MYCQLLFETGARAGEANQIEWSEIHAEDCTIGISKPEKHSNSRTVKISRGLIDRLFTMPETYSPFIFNPKGRNKYGNFIRQRRAAAVRMNKPQFLKIHYHTFRHARASQDIHNAVPLFEVKRILDTNRL